MASRKPTIDPSPIVEHMLRGFSSTTVLGGVRLGQSDLDVIAALGPPAEHTPEVAMENRRLWYVNYRQSRVLAGLTLEEYVDFVGYVHPTKGNCLSTVDAMLHGPIDSEPTLKVAFSALQASLAVRFKTGRNKSTFRAPNFDETGEGFVAVYFSRPRPPVTTSVVLKLTAGVVT